MQSKHGYTQARHSSGKRWKTKFRLNPGRSNFKSVGGHTGTIRSGGEEQLSTVGLKGKGKKNPKGQGGIETHHEKSSDLLLRDRYPKDTEQRRNQAMDNPLSSPASPFPVSS